MNSKYLLLVEGKSDQLFYESVCNSLSLKATIHIAQPKLIGGTANNKEGALKHLPVLLNQLNDGSIERLALAVDADHESAHGLGYRRTVDRVEQIVNKHGYSISSVAKKRTGGLLFDHADGLKPFGLWVMPGNLSDGMLEDWITSCVSPSELALFELAQAAVAALQLQKFKTIFRSKAEVATWLAWQKYPGRGTNFAVDDGLVDSSNAEFLSLASWLRSVFN